MKAWELITTYTVVIVVIVVASMGVNSFAFPYVINSWLEYADKPQYIVWWYGLVVGIIPIFTACFVVASLVTFILLLFL